MARRSLTFSRFVRSGAWSLVPILVLTAGVVPSGAQPSATPGAPDPTRDLAAGIDRLSETLTKIGDALREIRRDQRALVLARWIEMEERRFASMEEDLRRALAEKRGLEEACSRQESQIENFKADTPTELEPGAEAKRIPMQTVVKNLEAAVKLNRANAELAAARALELENALVEPRRELQKLRDRFRDWMDAVEE